MIKCIFYIIHKGLSQIIYDKKVKKKLILLWLLNILYYIINMLGPLLQSALLNGAVSLFHASGNCYLLAIGILGLLATELFHYVYYRDIGTLSFYLDNTISNAIQTQIYDKLCKISYSHFNSPKFLEKLEIVMNQFPSYCSRYLSGKILTSIIGTLISFIFTSFVLVNLNPIVAGIMVSGNVFELIKTMIEAKLNYYSVVNNMRERRYAKAYEKVLLDRKYLKEVKIFSLTKYVSKKWSYYIKRVNARTVKYNIGFMLLDLTMYAISNLFQITALVLTVKLILAGELSVGSFLLVYSSSSSLIDTSGSLFHSIRDLKVSSYYANLYREFDELPDVEPTVETKNINTVDRKNIDLVFDHVNFSYEGAGNLILKDICLNIKQGEKVAIVGENGCGKTTLVSLLNMLYTPIVGNIFISGVPLSEAIDSVRRHVVTLFQDYSMYETTIRQNIEVGDIYQTLSDEELIEVTKKSGIYNLINSHEYGLDTPIGRFTKGGIELSGGEWQKLVIARSLVRKDRKVLIMDEPNASLDPLSEAKIYKQIFDTIKEETLILISHRLGAAKYVDRIIVLDNGQIIEEGKHETLLKAKGKYYEMYNAQAKWYK